jgi:hypothetical protein
VWYTKVKEKYFMHNLAPTLRKQLNPSQVFYNNLDKEGRERIRQIIALIVKQNKTEGISNEQVDAWVGDKFKGIEVKDNFRKLFDKVFIEVNAGLVEKFAREKGINKSQVDTTSELFKDELQQRMTKVTTALLYISDIASRVNGKFTTSFWTSIYGMPANWSKLTRLPDLSNKTNLDIVKDLFLMLAENNIKSSAISSILSKHKIPETTEDLTIFYKNILALNRLDQR